MKVGTKVVFSFGERKRVTGVIEEVIKPNTQSFMKHHSETLGYRDHESYIVFADGGGRYWPEVSNIRLGDVCGVTEEFNASGSKYLRQISLIDHEQPDNGRIRFGRVDVYAVLEAFNVNCPARQHAIKKLLCAGLRGKAGALQDLAEARDAIDRAIQMQFARDANNTDEAPQ